MQIVIDIDEDLYREIKQGIYYSNAWGMGYAIQKGVILPKGHGRLIDADYLYQKFVSNKCNDSMVLQFIKDEPTVLETDKKV